MTSGSHSPAFELDKLGAIAVQDNAVVWLFWITNGTYGRNAYLKGFFLAPLDLLPLDLFI